MKTLSTRADAAPRKNDSTVPIAHPTQAAKYFLQKSEVPIDRAWRGVHPPWPPCLPSAAPPMLPAFAHIVTAIVTATS